MSLRPYGYLTTFFFFAARCPLYKGRVLAAVGSQITGDISLRTWRVTRRL